MNRFGIIIFCIFGYLQLSFGQFNFGPLLGINTYDVKTDPLKIRNKSTLDSFSLAFKEADYGFHFGGFARMTWEKFYIEPQVVFNTNKTTLNFRNLSSFNPVDSLKKEKFNYIDVPILFGVKLSILRLSVGPVMHLNINNKSDLENESGFSTSFKSATYGYHAGLGFDLGKICFDLKHEGNFTKYGDHLRAFGQEFKFDKAPTRLLVSLAYKF